MSLLQLIRSILCPKEVQPVARPFTQLYHRTGVHIEAVLRAAYPDAHIRIADTEYAAPTLDEFNRWIQTDDISELVYKKNWRDCENFARKLRCRMDEISDVYKTEITMCYCEGHTPSGYHAANVLIDNEDKIWTVEPQDDCVMLYKESEFKPNFIML